MEIIMKCSKENFNELRLWYRTIHLYKNYYLMRNYTYAMFGPSLWGIVKIEEDIPDNTQKNTW